MNLLLIILIVILLLGGGYGYSNRAEWGVAPVGGIGMVLLIIVILCLCGVFR